MTGTTNEPYPVLDEEVIGFRQWIVNDDLRLISTTAGTVWKPGTNTARCLRTDMHMSAATHLALGERPRRESNHRAPERSCACGFYALHEPTFWYGPGARASISAPTLFPRSVEYVAGLVAGWGTVEVHHTGFRAEHVRIVAIALPDRARGAVVARAVAAAYKVPTVSQADLKSIAGEFGKTIPHDLRPEQDAGWKAVLASLWKVQAAINSAPPDVVSELEKIRARQRTGYDHRQFLPKRMGGTL